MEIIIRDKNIIVQDKICAIGTINVKRISVLKIVEHVNSVEITVYVTFEIDVVTTKVD